MTEALRRFLEESNRIEGIRGPVADPVVRAAEVFLDRPVITVPMLVEIAQVFQPDARLRDKPGLNVRVGDHFPIRGGPQVRSRLEVLLEAMETGSLSPYAGHLAYEGLHPFTDGNGRTGRMLWLWQHTRDGTDARPLALGFLHGFYYETLAASRRF